MSKDARPQHQDSSAASGKYSAFRAAWLLAGPYDASRSVTAAPTMTAHQRPARCGVVAASRLGKDAPGRPRVMDGRGLPLALAGGWRPDRAAPPVARRAAAV